VLRRAQPGDCFKCVDYDQMRLELGDVGTALGAVDALEPRTCSPRTRSSAMASAPVRDDHSRWAGPGSDLDSSLGSRIFPEGAGLTECAIARLTCVSARA